MSEPYYAEYRAAMKVADAFLGSTAGAQESGEGSETRATGSRSDEQGLAVPENHTGVTRPNLNGPTPGVSS